MRYIRQIFFIFFVATSHFCFSNGLFFDDYDWKNSPVFEHVQLEEKDRSVIILKDLKVIEFFFDEEYNTLLQLYTVHTKVQVNTHEAIEMYNTHYMSMNRVLSIEDLRVRVITNNDVKEIDEIDLKDYEGKDDYSSYKYFAIEGVEIGSQIEYIYTLKMSPQLEGSREFFQSDELKFNIEFHIYCDDNMYFNTKSYNGLQELELDTTIEGKNHYFAFIPKIEPLKPELYAPYKNSLMRVEYKLDHILPANEVKLYTYEQLSIQLNQYLKSDITKKDIRSLKKLSKELGLEGLSEFDKIRKVESFIKRSITISDQSSDEKEKLNIILKKLVADERGVIKLYVSMFDLNDVDYRYGLTSDRTSITMDPDFESYSFLQNYIFYFPEINKYMAPTEILYRVGYIPFTWSNNYGLFIKNVKIGDTSTGICEVKFIEPLEYLVNEDKLDIKIDIEGDFDALNIQIKRTLTGYNATFIQPIFELIPESESKIIVNELLNLSGKDVELVEFNIKNASMDSVYLKPLIIQGSVSTTNSFYNKAGNRYLLKIGEVIGEQMEMYQDEERKLPVQNEFNRIYERSIKFEIPEGYNVRNLDDLNVDIFHQENGEKIMAFVSNYEIKDDLVTVSIKEYYKQLDFPVEDFDQFRKIINAAADFNKKVLIFEKE